MEADVAALDGGDRDHASFDETPTRMINRIHDRLRSVLVRACASSDATLKVVDALETCLKSCFLKGKAKASLLSHIDTLLEIPSVTRRTSGHIMARFYFDASDTTGGFHRLLLHAVCQFHGLAATSTTATLTTTAGPSGEREARLLTVTAKTMLGSAIKLTDHILPPHPKVSPSCDADPDLQPLRTSILTV